MKYLFKTATATPVSRFINFNPEEAIRGNEAEIYLEGIPDQLKGLSVAIGNNGIEGTVADARELTYKERFDFRTTLEAELEKQNRDIGSVQGGVSIHIDDNGVVRFSKEGTPQTTTDNVPSTKVETESLEIDTTMILGDIGTIDSYDVPGGNPTVSHLLAETGISKKAAAQILAQLEGKMDGNNVYPGDSFYFQAAGRDVRLGQKRDGEVINMFFIKLGTECATYTEPVTPYVDPVRDVYHNQPKRLAEKRSVSMTS